MLFVQLIKKRLLYEERGKNVYHHYREKEYAYSFSLPADPEISVSTLNNIARRNGLQEKVLVTEEGIFWNGKLYASFSEDRNFFIANNIDSLSIAVHLFHLLSIPLKKKLFD